MQRNEFQADAEIQVLDYYMGHIQHKNENLVIVRHARFFYSQDTIVLLIQIEFSGCFEESNRVPQQQVLQSLSLKVSTVVEKDKCPCYRLREISKFCAETKYKLQNSECTSMSGDVICGT